MQKQTLKFQNQLALVFAVVALAMPSQSEASAFSYMFRVGAGAKFQVGKQKFSGIKFPTYENGALKEWNDATDVETEAIDNQVLNLSAAFSAIYKFSDFCGVGPMVEVGYSFAKDRCKSWKSLTLKEGLFGKVGVTVSITDWVMISAGIRFAQLTADLSFSDEEKGISKSLRALPKLQKAYSDAQAQAVTDADAARTAVRAVATAADRAVAQTNADAAQLTASASAGALGAAYATLAAARAAAGSYSPSVGDYEFDISKSYSDTQNVWGGYLDFSVLLPITDAVKLVFTLGVSKDFASPEFGLGEIKTCKTAAVPAVTQAQADAVAIAAARAAVKSNIDALLATSDANADPLEDPAARLRRQEAIVDQEADKYTEADGAKGTAVPAVDPTWEDSKLTAKIDDRGFVVTIGFALGYSW